MNRASIYRSPRAAKKLLAPLPFILTVLAPRREGKTYFLWRYCKPPRTAE